MGPGGRRRPSSNRRKASHAAASRRVDTRVQYTVRNVPPALDTALRRKAAEAGMSLNEILLGALMREAGLHGEKRKYHDLDALAGTWVEDPEFDAAISAQDVIDESLWR